MDYEYEKWWKDFGRYTEEVIENHDISEGFFKKFGYRVYKKFKQSTAKCDNCGFEIQNK